MMEAQRWTEVLTTFDDVVELEPEARHQRLSAIGASDAELRQRVEELLDADAQAGDRLSLLDHALTPTPASRAGSHDADPLSLVGRTIARFRVIESLAYGGMGAVYRAEDTKLQRDVALKFPLPALQLDRTAAQQFLREARVAAGLDHPNLCAVHEVGETEDGQLFYAMPLYPGETLKERIAREGALPVADALRIAEQIATGLGAAHQAGIVHRDLKPANVMLLPDGQVKILDFGLATQTHLTLTDPFTTRGTLSYMAPEQIQGHAVDHRVDLWALGIVLHEMLTGQRPFQGEQAITVAHAIVHTEPVAPSSLREEVLPNVDGVVRTLLSKDPARRFAFAEEVTAALDARLAEPGPEQRSSPSGVRAPLPTIPASAPPTRVRLTRRPAIWGMAAAILLFGGFTVSSALGVGPAASLLARGTVTPDSLVIANVEIGGADSVLGRTIASMVGSALNQSNVVAIVPDRVIRPALQRMRRPVTQPLVRDIARELAQREGFKGVIETAVQRLGSSFVVTIQIVAASGDLLVSAYETGPVEELPNTIDRLTRRLRRRMGEPLRHIRASPPLPRVTSHSIEALRKFAEGQRALGARDEIRAVELFTEAVRLDSTFATAWVLLFAAYSNGNYPLERWTYALERAWQLRDRLPEQERYYTEGAYFRVGAGLDRVRAERAYEAGMRNDTIRFGNTLGLLYQSRREYARAESLFRWYSAHGITSQVAYENLANALYFQGKREESESVAVETARHFPNAKQWIRASWYLYNRALLDSARLMLEKARAAAGGDATFRRAAWLGLADLDRLRGRLARAERARSEAADANVERGISHDAVGEELWLVSLDVWNRSQPSGAVRRLENVLDRTPLSSLPFVSPVLFEPYYVWVARLFAQAGRPDRARTVLAELAADGRDPTEKRRAQPAVHAVRGEIALAEGRPMDALEEFRRADEKPDGPVHLEALGLHADVGRAFDRAGMLDSAIASFERYFETPQLLRTGHDATYLAHILQRLGALHEANGNRAKAADYYQRFVNLWRNADPELQRQVAMVRKRIEAGVVGIRAAQGR